MDKKAKIEIEDVENRVESMKDCETKSNILEDIKKKKLSKSVLK